MCAIGSFQVVEESLAVPGQGFHASWNCVCKISRTWKVLENEFGPGNLSGNLKCKVLESPGICYAVIRMADAMMRTQTSKYAHPHTSYP